MSDVFKEAKKRQARIRQRHYRGYVKAARALDIWHDTSKCFVWFWIGTSNVMGGGYHG